MKIENELITSYDIKNKIKTLLFFSNQNLNQEKYKIAYKNKAIVSFHSGKSKFKKNYEIKKI